MFSMQKKTLTYTIKTKLVAGLIKSDLKDLQANLDYSEYGGAGLFGLAAPVIKAHGSSNSRAIYNAIVQACYMVEYHVTDTIKEMVQSIERDEEGEKS